MSWSAFYNRAANYSASSPPLLQKLICSPLVLDSGFNHSRPLNKYHKSWSVVEEDRIDGWWNQRFAAEFKMRALAGQKKTFLVSKKKDGDRTKRSRPSNAEASLDNAGAVMEGAPLLAIFERWETLFFFSPFDNWRQVQQEGNDSPSSNWRARCCLPAK